MNILEHNTEEMLGLMDRSTKTQTKWDRSSPQRIAAVSSGNDTIQLAHGGGGRLTRELIDHEIVPRFGKGPLKGLPDAAVLPPLGGRPVFTTDSFVVKPLEFPGGNIGDLAVHGTVNDIAVSGGQPLWLSVALILEEGLPLSVLRRVLDHIKCAADNCGVTVATGDTKVVARGQGDGIFINTTGIGLFDEWFTLGPSKIQKGDSILVSGTLGDHGMAIMGARESMRQSEGLVSDSGPVHRLSQLASMYGNKIRYMRDPTRGGVATVLNEVVEGLQVGVELQEVDLPVSPAARALSDMFGIDILHVASEGRVLLVCDPSVTDRLLKQWRDLPEGRGAVQIGTVTDDAGRVSLRTCMGGRRLVDVPRGELLPRIC